MRIYLAGPDVFLPNAAAHAEAKKALVLAAGHEPLFPLDAVLDVDFLNDPKPGVAEAIFLSNREMIEAADAVLANLTPFRGPSADAGTVWECGFAFGLGKPVHGYSNTATPFASRVRAFLLSTRDELDVEDFELPSDNLMIHFGLASFHAHAPPPGALWDDLTSFRRALAAL